MEALKNIDNNCTVIDYEDLGPATVTDIGSYFGLHFSPEGARQVLGHFSVDAKLTGRAFTPDVEVKRRAATDAIKESVERWINAAYTELRRRRRRAAEFVLD